LCSIFAISGVLGREGILVAEEEFLYEIDNLAETSTRSFANYLGVSQEIRQNRSILNRIRLSWARFNSHKKLNNPEMEIGIA
jgi:hypothetical protein